MLWSGPLQRPLVAAWLPPPAALEHATSAANIGADSLAAARLRAKSLLDRLTECQEKRLPRQSKLLTAPGAEELLD